MYRGSRPIGLTVITIKRAIFSTFCTIPCDSHFATAPWKGLTNEMALEITFVGGE